ncbi:hypothetical protein [Actinomadura sp. NEAU-AAG7]|uniref:hypothetical protein n=1 Tax=Actinomadura sp. NEAU-AAG7 TaxID=2839640 RepID=UPI001BE43AA4|nr:hypothetical protein [Actinomadura sp. NEAU-AAG7]MBT2209832.1 hypothetical protein [Actinomadura sp. NEAU-AAG7]
MIILSGVLVVVAIALLVAGIVAGNGDSAQVFGLDALTVIYISIAVSTVSAVCLIVGVVLRRKELFGAGAPASASRKQGSKRKRPAPPAAVPATPPVPAAAKPPVPAAKPPAEPADDAPEIPGPPVDVPEDAVVFVVRGRKRYHLDTCRQLAGRDTEELTYAEAKEEGFSPCTACMPDTALAARAAVSVTAPKDGAPRAEPRRSDLTRPDLTKPAGGLPAASHADNGLSGLAKPAPAPAPSPSPFAAPAPSPGLDQTAEIPRTEPAAPAAPAPAKAAWSIDPKPDGRPSEQATVTDLPTVTEPPEAEPEDRAEPEPEPDTPEPEAPEPAAPRPRDADDEHAPRHAADPVPVDEPEPATADADEPPAGEAADTPGGASTDAPDDASDESGDASDGDGSQVRILSGTKRYHRTDCALIEDIGDDADDLESLSRAEAKARGCTPCLVCQPDRAVSI